MSMSRADILYNCIINHKVFDTAYDPKLIDWIAELYDIAEGRKRNVVGEEKKELPKEIGDT